MDEVTVRRQKKCAESREGHDWSDPETGTGYCEKCGLVIWKDAYGR